MLLLLLTWNAFGYPGPSSVLADGRGVVSPLELGHALHVDRLGVGHAGAGVTVGDEAVGNVRHDARSCGEKRKINIRI